MSYAEDLCYGSLRLVLCPDVEILRNHRPDFLRNPNTGRNLELDFYLPAFGLGFEVQGPHHYDACGQQVLDALKRKLLEAAGIKLFELSVFQVDPGKLSRKLRSFSYATGRSIQLAPFSASWLSQREAVSVYKRACQTRFGRGHACQIATASLNHTPKTMPVCSYATVREARVAVLGVRKRNTQVRFVATGTISWVKNSELVPIV